MQPQNSYTTALVIIDKSIYYLTGKKQQQITLKFKTLLQKKYLIIKRHWRSILILESLKGYLSRKRFPKSGAYRSYSTDGCTGKDLRKIMM